MPQKQAFALDSIQCVCVLTAMHFFKDLLAMRMFPICRSYHPSHNCFWRVQYLARKFGKILYKNLPIYKGKPWQKWSSVDPHCSLLLQTSKCLKVKLETSPICPLAGNCRIQQQFSLPNRKNREKPRGLCFSDLYVIKIYRI